MFEQALAVEYGRSGYRALTTMAGFAGQTLIVACAVIAPLIAPQGLPRPQELVTLLLPGAPVAPPPAAPAQPAAPARVERPPLQMRLGTVFAPTSMPARAAIIEEPPLTSAELGMGVGMPGGVPGGLPGGIPGGLPAAVAGQVAPPAPAPAPQAAAPPAEKPADPVRITVGGNVQHGLLIRKVTPVYPPLARSARIGGVVELMGIVGTDGTVRQLKVLSGHPLLISAAIEAVRQWVYRPTYLNGDPVEVMAPITVSFVLNQ